ncbi:MAG: hypothetical protein FJZ43_03960 [Candidatus Staskawiczbacteria bacterium]|nr:hypothetical protein [Candidatus Staskawiczbacteria bacterium]
MTKIILFTHIELLKKQKEKLPIDLLIQQSNLLIQEPLREYSILDRAIKIGFQLNMQYIFKTKIDHYYFLEDCIEFLGTLIESLPMIRNEIHKKLCIITSDKNIKPFHGQDIFGKLDDMGKILELCKRNVSLEEMRDLFYYIDTLTVHQYTPNIPNQRFTSESILDLI